jgi:hypothetical protein
MRENVSMKFATIVLLVWLAAGAGCVVVPMPADKLFGPGAGGEGPHAYYKGKDFEAWASSNASWELRRFDPATGQPTLVSVVDTNASKPLEQYPAWINSMFPAQQANFQWANTQQQLLNDQIGLAYSALNHLGDRFVEVAPVLWPHGLPGGPGIPAAGSGVGEPSSAGTGVAKLFEIWNGLPEEERLRLLLKLNGAPPGSLP